MRKTFRILEINFAVGREVGSHNGWSKTNKRSSYFSLFYLQIIIKKDYVAFIIL